jgi:predicted secreted protein
MRFNRLLILSVLSFYLFLPLLASTTDGSPGMKKRIRVDMDSNGSRLELHAGDEIQIELQGAGGTGYSWYFDKLDNDFFELIGKERKVQEKSGELVGSPTQYLWLIKVIKTGSSVIKMSYYRVWEGKDKGIRRFEVEMDIIP